MRLFRLALALTLTAAVFAQQPAAKAGAQQLPQAMLPTDFSGWQRTSLQLQTSANALDPNEAPVLKEYGFTEGESAEYTKAGGRKLTVKAARFKDATGAYGAFTYYREPQMLPEEIGDQAAAANTRVLFFAGNILVHAEIDKVNAMTAGEMRDLASYLPKPPREAAAIPDLAHFLPPESLEQSSVHYIVGPQAWGRLHAPVASSAIDWSRAPEALLADYSAHGVTERLALLYFPTPQIATSQLKSLESSSANASLQMKRVGPMVAIAYGDASPSEAKSLLGSISYEADVTYNEPTFWGKKNNAANLLFNAVVLALILAAFALLFGLFFGGLRVFLQRAFPRYFTSREEQERMITLDLRD